MWFTIVIFPTNLFKVNNYEETILSNVICIANVGVPAWEKHDKNKNLWHTYVQLTYLVRRISKSEMYHLVI